MSVAGITKEDLGQLAAWSIENTPPTLTLLDSATFLDNATADELFLLGQAYMRVGEHLQMYCDAKRQEAWNTAQSDLVAELD